MTNPIQSAIAFISNAEQRHGYMAGPLKAELMQLRARIADLESQLSAVGAGGVEPLRKPGVQPAVPVPDSVLTTIGWLLDDAMNAAVKNGANSISMPDDYVELAAWLAGIPSHPAEGVPAQAFKTKVFQALGIGSACNEDAVFVNIENARRRADCLSAIEREFFMVETPPDESEGDLEPGEECLLNWGHAPTQYVKQFAEALAATQPAAQGLEADLTDEQIDEAFNQMPDGAAGFLKSWGYRQFARAVLAAKQEG